MAHDSMRLASPPATLTAPERTTPPAPRLRLARDGAGRGVLDGGWWPRSRDTVTELTGLLTALPRPADISVTRVSIDFDDWDDVPPRISVLGREVRVNRLPGPDHVVAVTCGPEDPMLLLVIPPGAAPSSAEAALARSAVEIGDLLPQEILASCDISTAPVHAIPR